MAEAIEKGGAKEARESAKDGDLADPAAPGGFKRALPFLIGGTLSVGLGIASGIVTRPDEPEVVVTQQKVAQAPTPLDRFLPPHKFALPKLLANLADSGQPVSIQLSLYVEVRAKDLTTQAALEMDGAKGGQLYPVVRDALLMLLSNKQSTELRTPRGREVLKLEILDRLAPLLFTDPSAGVITGVYFDDLLFS